MHIITHALLGWGLATVVPGLSRGEKAWIVGAAVAPDLDGLGLVFELATRNTPAPVFWWSEYHHVLAHNLPFAAVLALGAAITRRVAVGGLVLASVVLHLAGDLVGSRGPDGYQWPLLVFWPFADLPALVVTWQWQLNAWPNIALSLLLLVIALLDARRAGSSPLELVSSRANNALVAALRRRFPSR